MQNIIKSNSILILAIMLNCTNNKALHIDYSLKIYPEDVFAIYNRISSVVDRNWIASIYRDNLIIVKSKKKYSYQFNNQTRVNRELVIYISLFKDYDTKEICDKLIKEQLTQKEMKDIFNAIYPGFDFDQYKYKTLSASGSVDTALINRYNQLFLDWWINQTDMKRLCFGKTAIKIQSEPGTTFGYADDFPEFKGLINTVSSLFNEYDT